jgi:hypothetical protein
VDSVLQALANSYRAWVPEQGTELASALHTLYRRTAPELHSTWIDAAVAAAAVETYVEAAAGRPQTITPELREAFEKAFPAKALADLQGYSPDQLAGIASAWKGKLFEILVRDHLNEGEWVGDIHLEHGQTALLADSLAQPGWDLSIQNADGTTADLLQLKAVATLGPIKEALERYPHFEIVATDEIAAIAADAHSSGVNQSDLNEQVADAMDLSDHVLTDLIPFMPFVVIAGIEAWSVHKGRRSSRHALGNGIWRSGASAAAMGAGYLVHLADGGLLSVPAAMSMRVAAGRLRSHRAASSRIANFRVFLAARFNKYLQW